MSAHTLPLAGSDERRAQLLASLRLSRHAAPAPAAPAAAPAPTAAPAPARRLPRWAGAALTLQAAALLALGWHAFGTGLPLPGIAPAQAAALPQAAPAPAVQAALPPATGARFEASGFIAANRTATVSARVMGQVAEVLVDEGARVQRGQVLARIADQQARTDFGLAQAQQAAAQARVAAAEAQLREAEREFEREKMLRDQNFTSDARLGKAVTAVDVARSSLASIRAEAALAALQVQRQGQALDDYTVRAPFDGVVLARNAQVGEIVAPGGAGGGYTRTGIYTIVDMRSLEIVVDVNEDQLSKVEPGRKVQAELYSHKGWQLAGEVLRVMPNADRAKSTVRVRIRLLEDDARILPDMAVKVLFL